MSFNFIIQNDVPLITWRMDEQSGSTISSDNYMSGYDGLVVNGSITPKKTPIIFGSPNSIMVSSNDIKIPSMGMMTNRYKSQPMSLEFWIKPKNGLSVYPRQQIVQLAETANGIYIENSSFVAIIGDNLDNSHKIVVPVENMNKPFHIVLTYNKESFSLYVNGNGYSQKITKNVFSDTYGSYSTNNQFWYFKPISGKPYALDNITIYSYSMPKTLALRHMTAGLGYRVPEGFESYFGGYRYSLCMNKTQSVGSVEKYSGDTWISNSNVENMTSQDGVLRIANLPYPELKYTEDKTDSVFIWSGGNSIPDSLVIADGGYLQINPKQVDPTNKGFAAVFRLLNNSAVQTLLLLQDPLNREFFIKIFAEGKQIKYQINNGTPATLRSVNTNITEDFTVGYFYDHITDTLKLFFSAGNGTDQVVTLTGPFNTKIFTTSHASVLRIGSNDIYSSNESFSNLTSLPVERFLGGIKRIVHLDTTVSTNILTDISARINKYTAIALPAEKRFIIKAKGKVNFKVDAKRLAGVNKIIGPNKVEWGHDSAEVILKAKAVGATSTGYADYNALLNGIPGWKYQDIINTHSTYSQLLNNPESNWFYPALSESEVNDDNSVTILNRSCFSRIVGLDCGVTKAIDFTFYITCQDVIDNPTKINFFRLIAYNAIQNGTEFISEINCNGKPLKYTFDKDNKDFVLPEYLDTPFLWCEEDGGFKVGRTAFIEYNQAPIFGETEGGLKGLSFFLNIPDGSSRNILSITKGSTNIELKFNGSLSVQGGTASIYVNGVVSNLITTGEWNHVIIILNTAQTVASETSYPRITFGSTSEKADFYVDEIMTFSDIDTSINEPKIISDTYRSIYIRKANVITSGDNPAPNPDVLNYGEMYFEDKQINNSTEIYQPMPHISQSGSKIMQGSLLNDVDLATYKSHPFVTDNSNLKIIYDGPNSLLIDGTYLKDQDKILVKNQSSEQNGIFVVTLPLTLDLGTEIIFTRQTPDISISSLPLDNLYDSSSPIVYVRDGVSNKGRHFIRTASGTFEETYFVKKVDAYTYEGPAEKTEIVKRKSIPV